MGPALAVGARVALRFQLPRQVPDAKVRSIEPAEGEAYRVDLHLIRARQKVDPMPRLPDVLARSEAGARGAHRRRNKPRSIP